MRSFIKSTLLFSMFITALIALFIVLPEFILNENADFKLEKSSKFIVIGHSHSECAFDDSFISDFTNLAESGESYFYTYFKLKKVLEQNANIETVFIEFTNNQINSMMDDWIWDDRHISFRYPKYSPFMDFQDKYVLASHNFDGFMNAISLSSKENVQRILSNNYNFEIGAHLSINVTDPAKLDSLIAASELEKDFEEVGLSEINLRYLVKITKLCKEKGKRVIFIRSPMHERYPGYSNESQYQAIRKKYFSTIEYLDFSKFPLTKSDYFDLHHLNRNGAQKFSKWFDAHLETELMKR